MSQVARFIAVVCISGVFVACGSDSDSTPIESGGAGGLGGSGASAETGNTTSGGTGGAGARGGTGGASASGGRGGDAGAAAGVPNSGGSAGGRVEGGAAAGAGSAGASGASAGAGGSGAGAGSAGVANGGTVTEGGAPPSADCEPGTGFRGQLTGPGSAVPNGGIFTTDPSRVAYGDANLNEVIAAYPPFDAVWEVDVDVHEAVVTATAGATPGPGVSAARREFWIADDNAVLKVALDPELGQSCCPDFDVRSGMRISFKVTQVSTFIRLGQITAASNFVAGSQGNCVFVAEPGKITDVEFYQMVRVSAQLSGEPMAGDGLNWWQLGLSDAVLYDFLSANSSLQTGQTITFVGPVSPYVGYHMLVESNPDWVMVQD